MGMTRQNEVYRKSLIIYYLIRINTSNNVGVILQQQKIFDLTHVSQDIEDTMTTGSINSAYEVEREKKPWQIVHSDKKKK